jgi:hypothetical protein
LMWSSRKMTFQQPRNDVPHPQNPQNLAHHHKNDR